MMPEEQSALVGAEPAPKTNLADTVPIEALAIPDEKEQMTPPEVGDEVTYQVTGKVVSVTGGYAQVQRSTINGQSLDDGDSDATSPDQDGDEMALRQDAAVMDGQKV